MRVGSTTMTVVVALALVMATRTDAAGPAADAGPAAAGEYASGHVIAKLRAGVTVVRDASGRPRLRDAAGRTNAAAATILDRLAVTSIEPALRRPAADAARARRTGLDRFVRVALPAGADASAAAASLRVLERLFDVVELDPIGGVADDFIPDDPSFNLQWGMQNTGQVIGGVTGTPNADVNAPGAWSRSTGAPDLVIATLDSGINEHPELAGRILPGWNVPQQNDDTADVCSHGTHVAGVIAASGDNAVGIAGMAWQVKLLPVVVVAPCSGPESFVADGLVFAVDAGAHVVNMSLQYFAGTEYLHSAVQYAAEAGVVMVAATGNANGPVAYPAKWPETIAVAATNNTDHRWSGSNFGPEVDVAAPGVNVYSLTETGGYAFKTGTSFATPSVTGLAALLLSLEPGLTPADVRGFIESTADDIESPGFDVLTGFGRIDAAAAVEALVASQAVPGDLNKDGIVNGQDLGMLLAAWGPCADCELKPCAADLDDNCAVGGGDLGLLLANWT